MTTLNQSIASKIMRALVAGVCIALAFAGFFAFIGFCGAITVKPEFQGSEMMIKGFGLQCYGTSTLLAASLVPVTETNSKNLMVLKCLGYLTIALAFYMITKGFFMF